MRIQYCSDLHLEIPQNAVYVSHRPLEVTGEVLVLAGDIHYLEKKSFSDPFFDWASANYEQVFWVPGNHEFYGEADLNRIEQPLDVAVRPNVRLLNNRSVVHGGINFIFTTLWSRISMKNAAYIMRNMADFHLIRYNGKRIGATEYNRFFQQAYKFLEAAVDRNESEKMVVVTHHLPTAACNAPEFDGSTLNEAFCVELHDFIFASRVAYWLFGHSHRNVGPVRVNETTLLSNQLGYVEWTEHRTFDPGAFLEV